MNEEALNYSFKLFKADGYNGTIEDYKALIKENKEALDYSYGLFSKDGYNGSIGDFSTLVGVGNQQGPAKETANAGSENQAVDTGYNLANGSLDLEKYNNIRSNFGYKPLTKEQYNKELNNQITQEELKNVTDYVEELVPGSKYNSQISDEVTDIYKSKLKSMPKTEFGTLDFDDEDATSTFYNSIISEFQNNNPVIQNEILPKIAPDIQEKTTQYANKLKQEMGLDDPNNVTQEAIDELKSKASDFYNKNLNAALAKDKDFQAINAAFNNKIEELQGPSYKRFIQGKDSPTLLKFKDYSLTSGATMYTLANAVENAYNTFRQIGNSLEDAGIRGYLGYQVEKEKFLENQQKLIDQYADDSAEGVWITDKQNMAGSWKFIPKQVLGGEGESAWRMIVAGNEYKEGTFADFKEAFGQPGNKDSYIGKEYSKVGKRLGEIQEKQLILSQWDEGEFDKIMAGEDIVSNSIALAGEQLPQMALALVTLGASSGAQIGSDIYSQGIDIEARKRFEIPDDESPTIEQLAEVLKDDKFMSNLEAKAVGGGYIAGQLERFGAGKTLKAFTTSGVKSILRGGYKNFLKGVANGTIANTQIGATEAITEVLQEVIQSGASGTSIDGEQLFKAGGTGFISSTALGIGGKTKSQTATEIKTISKIISGRLNPKSSEAFLNNKLKDLKVSFDNGDISEAAYNESANAIKNVKNANASIPKNFLEKNKEKALDLLIQKQELLSEIEGKDPSLTETEREIIAEIDSELTKLSVVNKIQLENIKGKKAITELELDNVQVYEFDTTAEVEEFANTVYKKNKDAVKSVVSNYGTIIQTPKSQYIILNNDVAARNNIITTANHEVLHAVLYKTLAGNPQAQIDLGKALANELKLLYGKKLKNSKFQKRFDDYRLALQKGNIKEGTMWEEALTLYSEALSSGDLKATPSVIERLKNFLIKIFRIGGKKALKDIRFDSGKDVVEFIKNYNKSFESGKWGEAFSKLAKEGAKGKLVEGKKNDEAKTTTKASAVSNIQNQLNELEDQLMDNSIDYDTYERKVEELENKLEKAEKQEVAEKKKLKKKEKKDTSLKEATARSKKTLDDIGNDPTGFNKNNPKIYEVLEGMIRSKSKVFRTAGGNVVNLTNLPGFEMENMVQETITGLVPLINKFDPKKNDSLFGYLNAQLANKMRGALKSGRVTEQKFTEDVTELKGVAVEETTAKQPEKPKYVKIMDADVFDTKVINAISDKMVSTVRVLKNKLITALGKNQNTSPLIAEILSDISTQADIDIKKAMGGKKDGVLRKFLLKNKQAIIENLTTTFLMGKDQGNKVLGGLPIAIQKQVDGKFLSYPDWVGKKIDRETTEKRGATAGNQIVRRAPANRISDADYLSFFLEPTGNPIRGRKEALAKEMAGELGLELFVEAIESGGGPIFDAFEGNRDRMGEVLGDYYAGEVIKQVERGTIKFSLSSDVVFETFKALVEPTKTKRKAALNALYDKYKDNAFEIKRVIVDPYEATWLNIERLVQKGEAKDRGIAYEIIFREAFGKVARKLREDGLKIGHIKRGVDGIDIKYNFQGKPFGLELKYMANARFSEFNVNLISRLLRNETPKTSIDVELSSLYIDELIKNKAPLVNYMNKLKELDGAFEKGDIYISPEAYAKMTTEFKPLWKAARPSIMMPWNFVHQIYNKKLIPVNTIQLLDIGAFWMTDNVLNTKNLPEFATFDKNGEYEKGIKSSGRFIAVPVTSRKDGRTIKISFKVTNTIPTEFRNKLAKNSTYNLSSGKGIETMFENSNIAFSKASDDTVFLGGAINPSSKEKGISVWDFDDTLATTKSNVLYTLPGGITGKLNAEEFAKQGDELLEQGAEFDFSEFSKVMGGAKGPMFDKAIKRNKKFGNDNVYILTARPANSATAIHEFLKGLGLDIKLENIVGLGNSTAQAKADWVKGMVAEGYNDFYFADDAYKNVKAVQKVLKVADVKSKVQQAIVKFSLAADPKMLNKEFNLMLERTKGVKAGAVISPSRAEQLGKGKGRLDLFLPPNAEDFQGLLYKFLGKGKQGNADMKFFKENLFDPFNRAENAMSTFRQQLADNLKILKKELGNIDEDIDAETIKKIEAIGFTPDQAVRVFVWNRLGEDIPDLTNQEKAKILSVVRRDASLMRYARELMKITKQFGGYPPPSKTWFAGNSTSDLYQYANENVRAKYLEQWQANADAIFSPQNMTKIQALYGKDFAKNLKEVLRRMKSGSNRPLNLNDTGSKMLDYINGSVGTIMFLNMRSAVLQTISAVNFLNWHDNNIFKAGATLANPKNFVKTFMEIMNSDFLKQRRNGLEINVSEAEIANAVEQSKNKAKAIFSKIIKFGYKPTQFADSFAIAAGGTSFLINRTNTYVKTGMSYAEAKEQAFTDFRAIAEENQQSSRTDRTSNIQASNMGRLVFAFNNTPFQMTRLFKKATLDLINGRGDRKTNISKMLYYGAIQNVIFFSLQQAFMAMLFGADEDDREDIDNRTERLFNSVIDSILRGSGLPGAVISTAKNVIMEYIKQEDKGDWRADHGKTLIQALNFSPPLGSKASRIYSALKGKKYEKTDFDTLRNQSKIISAITNIPVDRTITKIDNLRVAVSEPIETWKRLALLAGWDQWSLGVYDDLKAIEDKEKSKEKKKSRSEIMKEVWRKRKEEDKRHRDSIINTFRRKKEKL